MEKRIYKRSGQSLVEYIVVLALVAIIAISLINGVGQSSQANLQAATDGLEESRVATSTALRPHAAPSVGMSTPWSRLQLPGPSTRPMGRIGNTQALEEEPGLKARTLGLCVAFLTARSSADAVLCPTVPLAGRRPCARWNLLTAPWVMGPK